MPKGPFKEMLALVCVVKVRSDMSQHLQQCRVKSPLYPEVQQAIESVYSHMGQGAVGTVDSSRHRKDKGVEAGVG